MDVNLNLVSTMPHLMNLAYNSGLQLSAARISIVTLFFKSTF